jgi:alkylation response protein AidB-like acyl-CoA dehydrogenase
VRIKDSQRLCAVDDGWRATMSVTNGSRALAGGGYSAGGASLDVLALARQLHGSDGPLIEDPAVREKIADWYVTAEGLRFVGMRMLTALSRGQAAGPEGSIVKLAQANLSQDLVMQALELEDQFGIVMDRDIAPALAHFQHAVLGSVGGRIAGGTDEIMRNIIAERVLGLPGDIRIDKDVAFKDLPKSL